MKRYLPLLLIALALTGCGHKEGHRGFTDEAKDPTALGYDPKRCKSKKRKAPPE